MRKLLIIVLLTSLFSCDIGSDDSPNFQSEIMSITSVDIPSEFVFGDTYEITVFYQRPNECYTFERFLTQAGADNTRIVAVIDTRYFEDDCNTPPVSAEVSFNFTVASQDTYTFQFYQGTSSNGEDQYLIVEVPVVQ